ncbi:MAG TPA: MFS transporter [Gemmatimonadaceae bacterium]|nr:MFS transporter [Gemmatimonadaceae bacterium]
MHSLAALTPYIPLIVGAALALALVYARKRVPAALVTLMITAFVDMVGLLMVLPLLPFYAKSLGGNGIDVPVGGGQVFHIGIGTVVGFLVVAFTAAQLVSAPMWGRFSDRFGRRPALLVALGSSVAGYLIFAFANSLGLLFLSRLVQGAGGGTVGVIQAYVADSTRPDQRAKSLGWLSAATNLGVALGPVLGSWAVTLGEQRMPLGGAATLHMGRAAPGLMAALLCLANMGFAWSFLRESRDTGEHRAVTAAGRKPGTSRDAVARVVTHSAEPASRLIWIYAVAIGAFQGTTSVLALFLASKFGVNEKTIGYFFMYVGTLSVVMRAVVLGKAVDKFGEARLTRIGSALMALGLATLPLAPTVLWLALPVALLPIGTALTFPCVTALLSRVINPGERGLYMGVQQTFGGLSRVIFPLVLGFAFDHYGRGSPFWISATFVAATILLGLGMEGYTKPKPAVA